MRVKITREDLLRMEWVKLINYGNYEIWGYDNERMIWNPVTEEVVSKYLSQEERRNSEKNE